MMARCSILATLFALGQLASMAVAQEVPAQPNSEPVAEQLATEVIQAETNATPTPEAEAAKLKELLSLVQDNTKSVHRRETPAYFTLVRKVLARTPEQLRNEVSLNPRFNELYQRPSEYRGQLVNVKLNARLVLPANYENVAGVTRLYEIWGWTQEAKAWMYCCIVPELPEGFPEEGNVSEFIELTGYFFKMQAYQPGGAAPNAKDLVAPLIIGRVVRADNIAAKTSNSMGNWPMILIIGFGTIVMFRLMLHLRGMGRTPPVRRNYRRRSLEPIDPELVDEALDVPNRGIRIRNANEV